jgi:predicted nucleic acid-binding protein
MTLVDTNVLLDVATDDPKWAGWSLRQLDAAAMRGPVVINAIVYAEFSIGYTRIEDVDRVFAGAGLELIEIPRSAMFLAGKVFQRYRARRGQQNRSAARFFNRRPCSCGAIAFVDTRSKPLPEVLLGYCSHHAGH